MTLKIIRWALRRIIIQGPCLEKDTIAVFQSIREVWAAEFTEDNRPSQEDHLSELFKRSAR